MDTIKKYRKKPVVITAWQTSDSLYIKTLEGEMHASPGDWIITGVNGEQYPCKPDIFEKTYEPADLEPTPDARELALALAEGVWERNTLYVGARNHWLSEAAQLIAAHDNSLLDEAAELVNQCRHDRVMTTEEDNAYAEGINDAIAAIKGAAHE